MSEQLEVQKQYREQQSKFTYYLIAICIASIAFSINLTIGKKLNCVHIILGFAILNWCISVVCGFRHIKVTIHALYQNNFYFDVINGNIKGVEKGNPTAVEYITEDMRKITKEYSRKSSNAYNGQQWCFYIGMLSFLVWHVYQMAIN